MKKRGRPTVTAQHKGEELSRFIADLYPGRTSRTLAAIYYREEAACLLSEAASSIPHLDGIFRVDEVEHAQYEKGEILEQLGRMLVQDGYARKDVLEVARIAAQAYHDGCTVKQIKTWILKVRKDGTF